MTGLGVVVPAFRPDVSRLKTYLRSLVSELDPEVVRVELDDPDPETRSALSALSLPTVEVNAVPVRRGKGAAVTAGFEALGTGRLAFVDADGSTAAPEAARIVAALGGADIAVGSRRHPDSRVTSHQTRARRLLGDGFARLARGLLGVGVHDFQCGAKALTARAWTAVRDHLYEPGFAWDVELLAIAAALDLDIVEVPIEWEDRPGSTVAPVRTSLSMAKALFVARHRAKRIDDSRLHDAIARENGPALVERNSR